MIRIFLADEQPVVLAGLRSFFSGTEFRVFGETSDGSDLVQGVRRTFSQVVLFDSSQASFRGLSEKLVRSIHWRLIIIDFSASLKSAPKAVFLQKIRKAALPKNPRRRSNRSEEPETLTRREIEILGLIVQGHRNKDIAHSLGITVETVKNHVQHILQKTFTTDRTQAALWAIRQKIVSL